MTKVAVITGAGSGIGRAGAISLASAGWSIVLAGRRPGALEESASLLQGSDHLIVECDVSDEEAVASLFDATRSRFGRLDLLFNNAGHFGTRDLLEEISIEAWRTTVDTNVTGTFLCTREAFKIMKSQDPMGGRIINNGSISAHSPRENTVAYTATKHAITGLTKSASLDGRKYDIAVGQIDIGNASTAAVADPDWLRMNVDDVGEAIRYMAELPLSANVLFMTVMATKMPFVGRG
jgi:NAD(P)-dependent dehydrogenase (short-subunit alcohol dehydrogenase family)